MLEKCAQLTSCSFSLSPAVIEIIEAGIATSRNIILLHYRIDLADLSGKEQQDPERLINERCNQLIIDTVHRLIKDFGIYKYSNSRVGYKPSQILRVCGCISLFNQA